MRLRQILSRERMSILAKLVLHEAVSLFHFLLAHAMDFFRASLSRAATLERRGVFLHTHGGKKNTLLIVQ